MANSPQMPANMPIAQQRIVRGDAVRRLPVSVAGAQLPRYWREGVLTALFESPPWVMERAAAFTQCVVGYLAGDAITFDIKINGTTVETITLSGGGSPEEFTVSVGVDHNDEITFEMTDDGGGSAADVSWCLRHGSVGVSITPIEFVASEGSFTGAAEVSAGDLWVPGDYVVLAAWNLLGGTLTLPSWMTRLDGGAATDNPALAGGFIVDGLELDAVNISGTDVTPGFVVGSSSSAGGLMFGIGIYRNVGTTPVDDFDQEVFDDSPLNDDVGPIDIGINGAAVGLAVAGTNNTAGFVFEAPAVDRLSIETSASNNRAVRVGDELGGNSNLSFTVPNIALSAANHAWALALNAGAAGYTPTGSVSFVAAGTGVTSGVASTLTVPLPGGFAAGDLLVCVVECPENIGDLNFAAESGWMRLGVKGGQMGQTVFIKFAAGGDADPVFDKTSGSTFGMLGISFAYTNVAAVAWYEAIEHGNAAGPVTFTPARDVHVDGGMSVAIAVSGFYQPLTMPTANGYTQRGSTVSLASTGSILVADKAVPTASNPGMPSVTANTFDFITLGALYLLPS